ncbi:hypothetical protein MTO96_032886 [Rhipicephalus appendiculatus]
MATTEAGTASRRFSMVPTADGPASVAAVPAGAAPVVPVDVPPAQVYVEDEDEVAEIMKPQRPIVRAGGSSGAARAICMLCTAMVVAILAAAATYYVTTNTNKQYTEESTAYTNAKTPGTKLVFVPNDTAAEVDGRAETDEGTEDTTSNDGEATLTQST